jgi:HAE1 family hydrophobic/amphiphilic exporter-1
VIFLPLIFVQGVSGVLFKELAYVIMFSLSCALLVSLSLVPMLGSRLLGQTAVNTGSGWTSQLAAIGVVLTLFLTETTLNLQSAIGCIMLGGIVVNNAILLVDQAGKLRRAGFETDAALIAAGRRRLRPVLMTTLTTVLALLPLALGIGEGADAQAPLARTVVGGLAVSTLITLVLIPAVYSLFHSRPERLAKDAREQTST